MSGYAICQALAFLGCCIGAGAVLGAAVAAVPHWLARSLHDY